VKVDQKYLPNLLTTVPHGDDWKEKKVESGGDASLEKQTSKEK
jgi:hypothetical protein